jgi:hypothetical protein
MYAEIVMITLFLFILKTNCHCLDTIKFLFDHFTQLKLAFS